jgi:hypothetical protein
MHKIIVVAGLIAAVVAGNIVYDKWIAPAVGTA